MTFSDIHALHGTPGLSTTVLSDNLIYVVKVTSEFWVKAGLARGKFWNLDSLKCRPFPEFLQFGGRFYRILMGRKQHITYQNLQFVEKLVGFYHNLHLWKKFLLYTLSLGAPFGTIGGRGSRLRHWSLKKDWIEQPICLDQCSEPNVQSPVILWSAVFLSTVN